MEDAVSYNVVLEKAVIPPLGCVRMALTWTSRKYLKKKIPYYSNSIASFNMIICSGDIQVNPGPRENVYDSEEHDNSDSEGTFSLCFLIFATSWSIIDLKLLAWVKCVQHKLGITGNATEVHRLLFKWIKRPF